MLAIENRIKIEIQFFSALGANNKVTHIAW